MTLYPLDWQQIRGRCHIHTLHIGFNPDRVQQTCVATPWGRQLPCRPKIAVLPRMDQLSRNVFYTAVLRNLSTLATH
jgi:hypothetical protein